MLVATLSLVTLPLPTSTRPPLCTMNSPCQPGGSKDGVLGVGRLWHRPKATVAWTHGNLEAVLLGLYAQAVEVQNRQKVDSKTCRIKARQPTDPSNGQPTQLRTNRQCLGAEPWRPQCGSKFGLGGTQQGQKSWTIVICPWSRSFTPQKLWTPNLRHLIAFAKGFPNMYYILPLSLT